MEEQKRTRRRISKEEKIAALQAKVDMHEKKIAELKEQIAALQAPAVNMHTVTSRAKELGVSAEELLKAVEKIAKK